MNEIFILLIIGISLSMDAFSLSLLIGTYLKENRELIISLTVSIFHFIMPILGSFFGYKIISVLNINNNRFLGLILIIIAIDLIIHLFKKDELSFHYTFYGIIIFAVSVSLDSFSIGVGIFGTSYNLLLASSIFSFCSFIFTYLGLIIGKYANEKIGIYAKIIGIVLLILTGFFHFIK